jgi:hypothetical protein
MTTKDMASIIFRFFGVYALFMAITLLSIDVIMLLTASALHQSTLDALTRFFLPPLVMGALAFLLFAFSNQLALRILPTRLVDQHITQVQPQEIQALLFSFAGVLVIAQGLNVLSQRLPDLLNLSAAESTTAIKPSWWMLAPGLLQILFGITIFIQARAISSLWYRIHPPTSDNQ